LSKVLIIKDCDASYVGQTGRLLKTRISEHQSHIRRNNVNDFRYYES